MNYTLPRFIDYHLATAHFKDKFYCKLHLFFFFATPWHLDLPGQESELSHSHSCGNRRSLNPRCRARIKPVCWRCRDATNPRGNSRSFSEGGTGGAFVFWDCHKEEPQTRGLITEMYCLHFWELKAQGHGVSRAASF